MQKFTIFTIIFSLAVIFVMAELVINDYLESRTEGISNLETSVIQAEDIKENTNEGGQSEEIQKDTTQPVIINSELLSTAGIENAAAREVNFNGKLFNLVALVGIENEQVLKKNIFSGQEFKFTIYEIPLADSGAAQEMYNFVKSAVTNVPNIAVNETNNFGSGSFYVNDAGKKQIAFLVIKTASAVYGFEYTHPNHPLVKNIISKITN